MPEGSVPDIMSERDSLNQIQIQIQRAGDRRRDVIHIDDMFDPGTDVIVLRIEEHLCFMTEPSECL